MDAHTKALSIGGRPFKSSSVNVIFKGKKVDVEQVVKVEALVVGSEQPIKHAQGEGLLAQGHKQVWVCLPKLCLHPAHEALHHGAHTMGMATMG